MKSRILVIGLSLILVILSLGSCDRSGDIPTETTPTTTVFPNPLAVSTASAFANSATPNKVVTSILTSTKETTPIPISSPTDREVPTQSAEHARVRLVELLANNGGCQLPCFWGITPGETTAQQARNILAPLSSLSDYNAFHPKSGTILLSYGLKKNQMLDVFISYLEDQNNVYGVSFEARDLIKLVDQQSGGYAFQDVFDSPDFGEKLDFYMLNQVLKVHGRPSSVLLTTWGKIPSPRYGQENFKLILLYPERGIAVQYTTEMRVDGDTIVGCLANAHVEMGLFPPGDADNFYQQLALTDWQSRITYYKPLEDVTSMSVDDFYEAFRQSRDECLVTPANLWSIPEN